MIDRCPLCNNCLIENGLHYYNLFCDVEPDHYYTLRTNIQSVLELRFRIEDFCVIIDYLNEKSKLWKVIDKGTPLIITIKQSFIPDFSDRIKLKMKLQTYLIFS